jgi:hypothetical protein
VSLRKEIADVIAEACPKYKVLPYMRELDGTTMPVVMVHRTEVAKTQRHAELGHKVAVHVLIPETWGERVEDAADAALEAVLTVIEDIESLDWTTAERSTYNNFAGWEITLTATTGNYLLPE